MRMSAPALATNVFAALWKAVTVPVWITPEAYTLLMSGTRNVRPLTLRPFTMPDVCHRTNAPAAPAYDVAAPEAATVLPPAADQLPLSTPVLESSTSPLPGIVQDSPVGNEALMAVKKAPRAPRGGPETESL